MGKGRSGGWTSVSSVGLTPQFEPVKKKYFTAAEAVVQMLKAANRTSMLPLWASISVVTYQQFGNSSLRTVPFPFVLDAAELAYSHGSQ